MRKSIFSILAIAMVITGCTSEEPVSPIKEPTVNNLPTNLEYAINIAEKMISDLDGTTTRSVERRIKSVEAVLSTRSGNAQDFYVVNYEDEKGFALISATDKRNPVYGFSNEGSLTNGDIMSNPGMNDYLNSPWPSDSTTIGGWGPGFNPGKPTTPKSYGKVTVSPILPKSVAEWHQDYPFNRYYPDVLLPGLTTGVPPTGCVPLSCAMIMSHYEWPISFEDVTLNWSDIVNNHNNLGLQKLIYHLSKPVNLDAQFFLNESKDGFITYTSSETIPRTFYNMGYQMPKIVSGISSEAVSAGHPALILGINYNDNYNEFEHSGHCWVIDGIYKCHYDKDLLDTETAPYDEYYYHTIWGLGGYGNGYFRYNTVTARTPEYTEEYEVSTTLQFKFGEFLSIGVLTKK